MSVRDAFSVILRLLAVLMFLLAAFTEKFGRIGLVPIGLALFAFAELIDKVVPVP